MKKKPLNLVGEGKNKSPTGQQIKDLRKRHSLTQAQLAESLYRIKEERIADWENERRNCPPIIWWSMVLTHDERDLWSEDQK